MLGLASVPAEETDQVVAIYADGASLEQMERYAQDERIEGLTTNPSLMRRAGITNYRDFARTVLDMIGQKPVSFEVLADDFYTMERQAREIAEWGPNVWVKIPITNSRGESSAPLIRQIADLQLNITAVMTIKQWESIRPHALGHHIVSVFCGRIMDTLQDPMEIIGASSRLLWASAREIYNVKQAADFGYDIITLTPELIAKLDLRDKDLTAYSLETVRQFHSDGKGIAF